MCTPSTLFLPRDDGGAGRKTKKRCEYSCGKCQVNFGTRCELEEHTYGHTGEMCSRGFEGGSSWQEEGYGGQKPFHCQVCLKGFSRRSSLWNHNRIHLERRPFKCPLCDARFKWKNSLHCHRTMHVRADPSTGRKFDELSAALNITNSSYSGTHRQIHKKKQSFGRDISSERAMDQARDRLIRNFLDEALQNEEVAAAIENLQKSNENVAMAGEISVNRNSTKMRRKSTKNSSFNFFKSMAGDQLKFEKVPAPVTKKEMEAVAKTHYLQKSQFLYRNFDPSSSLSRCPLLPTVWMEWTGPDPDDLLDQDSNSEPKLDPGFGRISSKLEKMATEILKKEKTAEQSTNIFGDIFLGTSVDLETPVLKARDQSALIVHQIWDDDVLDAEKFTRKINSTESAVVRTRQPCGDPFFDQSDPESTDDEDFAENIDDLNENYFCDFSSLPIERNLPMDEW